MFKRSLKTGSLAVLVLSLMVSCGGAEKLETKSGVKYTLVQKGSGSSMEMDQVIVASLKLYDANDSLFFDFKEEEGNPLLLKKDTTWSDKGQFFEVLDALKVGDSVHLSLGVNEFFNKGFMSMPPQGMNGADQMVVKFKVLNAMDEDDYEAYTEELMQKAMEQQKKNQEKQLVKDAEALTTYLAENNIEAQKTESGLFYVLHEQGNGKQPETGQKVEVNYVGMLLDGTVFDTSIEERAKEAGVHNPQRAYGSFSFSLGVGQVIRGWDEGIAMLSEGAKATLYIPSAMAYGERGAGGVIPPNANLIFEVELVKIIEE